MIYDDKLKLISGRNNYLLMILLLVTHMSFFSCMPNDVSWNEIERKALAENNGSKYYTRYRSYPRYCATPPQMSEQNIPPVNSTLAVDIVQSSIVIRHGQRTPWSAGVPCWKGYHDIRADTSKWDCEHTTWTSPPRSENEHDFLIFQKKYDALLPPLQNELGGTCQKGQLLAPGFEQHEYNGMIIRNAYFGDANKGEKYQYMNLFLHNDSHVLPHNKKYTYYRSDDDQRTLMSGQILLRSLFNDGTRHVGKEYAVELHTADRSKDILSPNEKVCPALRKFRREAEESKEFQKLNTTSEAKEMRRILREDMGSGAKSFNGRYEDPSDFILDCLMTTICTDRTLPPQINDYGSSHDGSVFERMVDFVTSKSTFHFLYNDAAYSKVAMGPLWSEIIAKMLPITELAGRNSLSLFSEMEMQGIPRLALYSGHDTTIMPLLASLGNKVWDGKQWTPYASMFIIELYVVKRDSDPSVQMEPFVFRLLYNGEVITGRMDNCVSSSELCPLSVLLQVLSPFASSDQPLCVETVHASSTIDSILDRTSSMMKDPLEQTIVLAVFFSSAMLGWFVTYVIIMKRIPFKGKRKPIQNGEEYGRVS